MRDLWVQYRWALLAGLALGCFLLLVLGSLPRIVPDMAIAFLAGFAFVSWNRSR